MALKDRILEFVQGLECTAAATRMQAQREPHQLSVYATALNSEARIAENVSAILRKIVAEEGV